MSDSKRPAPEPTAEHRRLAREALPVNATPGQVNRIARALAAVEARGFERGRAAGPAPYVDPLADAAGNRHHKDGSRCTDPNCRRAHALPAVLFTLSSCLYPEPR